MSYEFVSVVLPTYRQVEHIESVLRGYDEQLALLPMASEIVVVVNGPPDGSLEMCRSIEQEIERVHVIESRPGWGNAVRHGLEKAQGDLLCFTNSARTSAERLSLVLGYAIRNPGVVVKASRKNA